jgi:hypothetical protein
MRRAALHAPGPPACACSRAGTRRCARWWRQPAAAGSFSISRMVGETGTHVVAIRLLVPFVHAPVGRGEASGTARNSSSETPLGDERQSNSREARAWHRECRPIRLVSLGGPNGSLRELNMSICLPSTWAVPRYTFRIQSNHATTSLLLRYTCAPIRMQAQGTARRGSLSCVSRPSPPSASALRVSGPDRIYDTVRTSKRKKIGTVVVPITIAF